MSMESYEELKQKINLLLISKAEWISAHWFEAYEDLIYDHFAEIITTEPDVIVDKLPYQFDSTVFSPYSFLSGKEIKEILKSRMTNEQIVDILIRLGEVRSNQPETYLTISSFNFRNCPEEIFVHEDQDLSFLVDLLPEGHPMKRPVFEVSVDPGRAYFCVKADRFLNEVAHVMNAALADDSLRELLEA